MKAEGMLVLASRKHFAELLVLLAIALIACGDDDGAATVTATATVETSASAWPGYRIVRTIGRTGQELGELRTPMGLDVGEDGRIAVADTGNRRVQVFDDEGNLLSSFTGTPEHPLGRPMDVAFAPDGSFWIAEFQNDALFHVSPEGDLLERRDGDAAPSSPAGITVLPDGRLAVTSFYDHALHIYDGEEHEQIGEEGGGPGQFHYPTGVFVDPSGRLLIADSYNHRIERLDLAGRPSRSFRGPEDDALRVPVGAAVTPGVLHVADSENHRVVALDAESGDLLAEWVIGERRSETHTPSRIVGRGDVLYIADPANDVIVLLTKAESPR